MLSILIPTYNYNAFPLAETIEQQALKLRLVFELICIDDGSFSSLNKENQKINHLTNCKFIENTKNVGSLANRLLLANKAHYKWLLFLDADINPKYDNFLETYLKELSKNVSVVFGGFAYYDKNPEKDKMLRYTFGKQREEVSALKRNKNPYKVIISANFLVKKQLFIKINQENLKNIYGLDYLFGAKLKQNKIKVNHIENEVNHLGIDDNQAYLEKSRKAVETLSYLYFSKQIQSNTISLLKAFKVLHNLGLRKLFGEIMLTYNSKIESNLISKNPNLFLFDLYRLGYFCRIKHI